MILLGELDGVGQEYMVLCMARGVVVEEHDDISLVLA